MKQRKLEKFSYLKYNPQKKSTAIKNKDVVVEAKHFDESAIKRQAPPREISEDNINNHQNLTIYEKL